MTTVNTKNIARIFVALISYPNILEGPFDGTHFYSYFSQEHNTMTLARVRTRNARSGVQGANHKATALLQVLV